MNNPYGQCQHTKYDGSEPCIHDAYQRGREDAAKMVSRLGDLTQMRHFQYWRLRAIKAARGGEQE